MGYQGTNSFYNNYFSPPMIITPDYFGTYAEYNSELQQQYTSIVCPHLVSHEKTEQTIFDYGEMRVYHAASNVETELNTITIYNFTVDADPWIDLVLPFEHEISLNNLLWPQQKFLFRIMMWQLLLKMEVCILV